MERHIVPRSVLQTGVDVPAEIPSVEPRSGGAVGDAPKEEAVVQAQMREAIALHGNSTGEQEDCAAGGTNVEENVYRTNTGIVPPKSPKWSLVVKTSPAAMG